MLVAFIRKIFLTLVIILILSVISYHILLRDPLNHFDNQNIFIAYCDYLKYLLSGNWGISYNNGEELLEQMLSVFPATIMLCLSSLILAIVFGLPLGFFSAYKKNNLVGKSFILLGTVSLAIPVFWFAIMLLYYASINQWEIASVGEINAIYQLNNITGFKLIDIFLNDSPYQIKMMQSLLHHLALPALILALPATLEIMRFTQLRASYVMQQPYIKVAQTRAWSLFKIWRVHILRNTLPAIFPMLSRTFILIFAFGMLIENIFSWNGIGRWLINALSIQDYNAISAGVMLIGLFVLMVNLLTEFITFMLDPSHKKDWYDK